MGLALRCAWWTGDQPTTGPPTPPRRLRPPDGRSASRSIRRRCRRLTALPVAARSDRVSADLGQGRAPVREAARALAPARPAGVVARKPERRSPRRRRRRWWSDRRTGRGGATNPSASLLLSGRRAPQGKRCLETIAARAGSAQRDQLLNSSPGQRGASAGKRRQAQAGAAFSGRRDGRPKSGLRGRRGSAPGCGSCGPTGDDQTLATSRT